MNAIASTRQATHYPALRDHVHDCRRARGSAFILRCMGEGLHGVLGPRFVTTVVAAATLIALLGWA